MLLTKSIKLVMLISVQGSLGGEAAPGAGGPAVREFPYGPAAAPPGAGGTCGPGRGYRWRCGLRSRRRCRGCPAAVPKVHSGGAEGAQWRCRGYPAAVPRVPSGGRSAPARRGHSASLPARGKLRQEVPAGTAVTCGTASLGLFARGVFRSSGLHLCRPPTAPSASPVPTPLPVQRCP
ncbi:collagen alpha-1(II) chain-like isoform X6 [Manacus candei]|uniref:collagen alpha-1(II) chain-like isoform X6 n=1 Tax=Manacus candei TaxID=415023 RepID=UPI002225C1BB|nr:collagen alpha-1(II) chain-like isoform X6 [Manacus candei]